MNIIKFVFSRTAALVIVVLLGSLGVASAQATNAGGGINTAAAGTNGGPTQTVVVNTSSNPVPTLSVGTTTIAGAITVANAQSSPVPVSDPERRPQNRLTISTWTNSGTSWTGIVNAYGQRTAISALPAGKLFVVTDVELEATGSTGAVVLVDVLHSSTQYAEFESSLVVTGTGRVTERIHLVAGPVFADLPTMWFAGGQGVSATLWGYLVDAQ